MSDTPERPALPPQMALYQMAITTSRERCTSPRSSASPTC